MTEDKKNGMPNPEEISSDITAEERPLLDESLENSSSVDNNNLWRSALDNTDDSGELLNEESSADDLTGEDLDIPGSELDDANEDIGEEDEENNGYSQADTE